MNYVNVKRILDVIFSLMALILLLPLCIVIILVSSVVFKGNIFFSQERLGKENKLFRIWKFKTMFDLADLAGASLSDEKRTGKYGRFLREFSLDEIPQLINVIKGDISMVGPRPLLPNYLSYFKPEEIIRHSVKPGLTGLTQIKGRNNLTWEERFRFDLYYVNNYSFFLDTKIILITILHVWKGQKNSFSVSLTEERELAPS